MKLICHHHIELYRLFLGHQESELACLEQQIANNAGYVAGLHFTAVSYLTSIP